MSDEEQIVLPKGYRRVDYLEATGTQYINTSYIPSNTTGLYVKAVQITSGDGVALASLKNDSTHFFVARLPKDTSTTIGYGWGGWYSWGYATHGSIVHEAQTNFYNNRKAQISINGEVLYKAENLATLSFTPQYSLWLFGANTAGSLSRPWKGRIYDAKITENDELKMYFVPAIDQYNTPCMYDLVSQKPFYNSGSGQFTYPYSLDDLIPVPYLISNGNQRIDTGYIPKKNSGFWVDAQALYEGDRLVMGSGPNSNNNSMTALRVPGTNGNSTGCYWNAWQTFDTLGAGRRFVSETNFKNNLKANLYIDGDLVGSKDLTPFAATPTYSVYLFGSNNNGSNNSAWIGKIYRAKISEGEEIIHDYVPMIDPIGRPCMYDKIDETIFYTDNLSNNFIIPKNIEIPASENDFILPAGYTKCVYLQSDDKQYIDTGIIPNDLTGLSIKGEVTSLGSTEAISYGVIEDTTGCRLTTPYFTNTTNGSFGYNWNTAYGNIFYNRTPDRIFYTSLNLYNNRYVYYSSKHINYLNGLTLTLGNFTQPIWLFTYNSRGSYNTSYGDWQGKVFRAQITQGDALVRDFVPCLDEAGKPCMYDLVSETPFYNQGTGADFSYCVEHSLPSDFIKLRYLESFGKQYISTGVIPNEETGLYVEAYHTGRIISSGGLCLALRQTNGDTYFSAPRVMTSWSVCYGWNNSPDLSGTFNTKYEGWMNWLNSKKVLVTSPVFADKTATISTALNFTATEDLYLFNQNIIYDKSLIPASSWRIYRARISQGSQIIRDFVPAFDIQKQKPCMYDLIENKPYYNDGEGELLYDNSFEGKFRSYGQIGTIGNKLGWAGDKDYDADSFVPSYGEFGDLPGAPPLF